MRKSIIYSILSLLFLFVCPAFSQTAQEEQILKEEELDKPGTNHIILQKFDGKWNCNIIIPSGSEPNYARGKTDNQIIMNGRYIEMFGLMEFYEIPVKTRTIIGYDNRRETYSLVAFDEIGTSLTFADGKYDEKEKLFTFTGETFDSMKKEKLPYKITFYLERDNKYVYTFYQIVNNKELKRLECVYIKSTE